MVTYRIYKSEVLKQMRTALKEMILRARKIGGSYSIIIPKTLAELYGVGVDSGFEVIPAKDEFSLVFRKQKKETRA